MIDRDKINHASRDQVAQATVALVDANQARPAEVQVVAAATLYLLLCDHYGVRPQDIFDATNNLINDAEGRRPEIAGVADYIQHELS